MVESNRILVVEDNDFVRAQILSFLSDAGCYVIEAMDGEEALKKMKENVDIAIVDVRMEPMGGFDFIRMIRGCDMETPVILVTGDSNSDLLNEAGKLGVASVLMKPVQKDRLLKTVEKTMSARVKVLMRHSKI